MSFANKKMEKMKNRKKTSSLRTPHRFGNRRSMLSIYFHIEIQLVETSKWVLG